MVLTNERAELLAKYIADKKEAGYAILELDAKIAAEKINADGFDFTAEEICEFVECMEQAAGGSECELDEGALDDVAGGIMPMLIPAVGVILATGIMHGYRAYKKSKK